MSAWWKKTSELDADQQKVIGLPKDGNYLILGPAGCGKTNLLLLRATYLTKAGVPDIKILTFGRVLKEFLVAGTTHYPFSPDRIQTYLQWGASLLDANGIEFDRRGEFPEVRARLLAGLKELAAQDQQINVLDCILLDEAQDYSAEEIETIVRFADQIYAVGDDRQRVTDAKGGLKALKEICEEPVVLTNHYRNGVKICRVADGIRNELDSDNGMEAWSKYNESEFESSVVAHPSLSLTDQVTAAIPEIENQLFAYPDETIGILCPKTEDAATVAGLLQGSSLKNHVQYQNFAEGYAPFDPDKRVIVTTIISAKGLEFRALHLLGMERIHSFRDRQKNLAFTGVTRAKTSLHIYYDRSVPGYLEKGIIAVNDVVLAEPKLDDLFN